MRVTIITSYLMYHPLLPQAAKSCGWNRLCCVWWCSFLQQGTHTQYCEIWLAHTNQERRSHSQQCQLSWHLTVPLGGQVWYWPRSGWKRFMGHLRYWSQQWTTCGQPGQCHWKVQFKAITFQLRSDQNFGYMLRIYLFQNCGVIKLFCCIIWAQSKYEPFTLAIF